MPNWKKVLVSGSNAELNQVTASYFIGDGSALTNLPSPPIVTYNSAADNRIITSVNSSTVQGEDKLTFDGDGLTITGHVTASGNISGSATSTGSFGHVFISGSISGSATSTGSFGKLELAGGANFLTSDENATITGDYTFTAAPIMMGSGILFEGSTNNSFETRLDVIDPTSDKTINLPDIAGTVQLSDATQTISGDHTFSSAPRMLGEGILFEGSTNNTYEIRLDVVDPTADRTILLPDTAGTVMLAGATQTDSGNKTISGDYTFSSAPRMLGEGLLFEGSTNNTYEIRLDVVDPTADRTILLPDAAGTVMLLGAVQTDSGNKTITGDYTFSTGPRMLGEGITFEGSTNNTHEIRLDVVDPTADRTILLPDAAGTVMLLGAVQTDSGNKTITGDYTFSTGPRMLGEGITFEGSTNNTYEIRLDVVDPTADRTILLPDAAGTVMLLGVVQTDSGNKTITGDYTFSSAPRMLGEGILFEGSTNNSNETRLDVTDPTGDRTINLPDESGTVALTTSTVAAATKVTVTDNESTDESNLITFVAGASATTGNKDLEMDGNLTYNPSSGELSATTFAGSGANLTNLPAPAVVTYNSAGDNRIITSADATSIQGESNLQFDGSTLAVTGAVTISGNLSVSGTTTTVNSTEVSIADRILTLNAGSAAGDGGIYVNDASTAETGSLLWDVSDNRWIGGLKNNEVKLVTLDSTDTLTNKTLTAPVITSIVPAGGQTLTLPTTTDTLVGRDTTDTLTNKTLTSPVISSIINNGSTITLPTTGDTLVGRSTTDTLHNKTLHNPVITGTLHVTSSIVFEGATADSHKTTLSVTDPTGTRGIIIPDFSGTVVLRENVETLINKTLTAPIITTIVPAGGQTLTLPTTTGTLARTSDNVASATVLETARTIGGVSFNGSANIDLPGVNSAGNQDTSGTATNADHVKVTDNEDTNEENLITFVENGHDSTGNYGLEMDGQLTYNPSTGTLSSTVFSGNLSGTATNADHVKVTDNENDNENNLITFVENAQDGTGNHGLEMDGQLYYNPSSGTVTATGFAGNLSGNATTATQLANSRNIGGVSFNGGADINLPGVNTAGNQDTSGNAATATQLATARNIGGVSFNGTSAISLPGVNTAGNQDTSGNAATATKITSITNSDIVQLTTTQTLTNKTLTSPVLNTGVSGTAIKDEDDLVSDSNTHLATQQSIKAYVDASVTAQDLDIQGDTGGALSIDLDSESLTIAGGTGIDSVGGTNTITLNIDSTVTTLAGSQTLTNKTLTTPIISSISNTGTITLPTSTDTLVGRATTDTLTNKTLTSPVLTTPNVGTVTAGTWNGTAIASQYLDSDTAHLTTDQTFTGKKTFSNAITGSHFSGSSVSTGSFGRVFSAGDSKIDGNLDVIGTLTAKEFHTTVTSASIVYADGSNKFGNSYDDIHNFTGSLIITGSISGSTTVSASFGNIMAAGNVEALGTGSFRKLEVVQTIESQGIITAPGFVSTGQSIFEGDTFLGNTLADDINLVGHLTASTGVNISGSATSTGSFGRVSTATLNLDSIVGNWTNVGNTVADLGTITTADINGGTIDGATIGGATIATSNITVGSSKTLDVSAGSLTTSATQNAAIVNGVGANVDIGAYELRAQTLEADVSTGTAPLTIASTTLVSNLNADLLDSQEGSYYTDFTNMTVTAGEVTNTMLTNDSINFGGVSVALGSNDDTPAFNLSDATAYTGDSSLVTVGTIGTGTWAATDVAVTHGGTGASNASSARTNLGLVIGTDVQAYDAQLNDVAGLAVTDGGFIVGDGSNFVLETGATARTSLGVDAAGTDNSTNVTIAGGSKDYITLSGQALTINQIDLTDDVTGALPLSNTALVAGTNISLSTNTLNVDDAFLVNDADDTTSGKITAGGFITTATGSFTHISTTSKITGSVSSTGSFGRMEIAGNFVPKVHNVSDLGSTTNRWANIYSADLQLSNMDNEEGNEIDGTKGSWTIQEGSDDLYLLNRRNGKKYRFKLEEIT